MLDSLGLQLREAEARRADVEKVHKETLLQIRDLNLNGKLDNESVENLYSKARELEKKVALETVRCEELQLELSAAMKSKSSKQCTSAPHISSSTSVTWTTANNQAMSSEVELLMAKIEQDNRVLAELEEPKTSGSALISGSIIPGGSIDYKSISKNAMAGTSLSGLGITTNLNSNVGNGINTNGGLIVPNSLSVPINLNSNTIQSLNTSNYCGTSCVDKVLTGTAGINIASMTPNVYSLKHLPPRGTIQLYNLQSTTMPILSLQGSHLAPSNNYALGLSGFSATSSYMSPNIGNMVDTGTILGNGLPAATTTNGSSAYGLSGVMPGLQNIYSPLFIDSVPSLPHGSTIRSSKAKILDDIDFSLMRYGNRSSPCSPIPPNTWGFDDYSDSLNSNLAHSQRGLVQGSTLDFETRGHILNGTSEPQVDMLDIPGKGRCCVFITRFSYDPPEDAEGELSLSAGDYLLVWSSGEPQGGFLDAELLDGRRGLVPSSFVQRLVGDDLLEFHQAVLSTLRDADDGPMQCDATLMPQLPPNNSLITHTHEDLARLSESQIELENENDIDDSVPAPKHLTLERQMNKSVLIGWSPGETNNYMSIECYHVYVDSVLKVTVKATDRTRALIEGVDSSRPHRISVRSVTQNRKTSRDAACTMIIGRDTSHLGPSAVRASNITSSSAIISWLPANSNHQHIICVNNVEVRIVKPGIYRHTITGLSPSTQYRVTVRAKHLRASGTLSASGTRSTDEAPGAYADFRTLAKGLPDPPQDIQLEAGPQDGTILVTWQPVNRPSSSGPVTGYSVYADGKKVTDINSPTGDHALIDIGKLSGLNPRTVTIRTKSRDSQSADSTPMLIPNIARAVTRKGPVTILAPGRVVGSSPHNLEQEDPTMQCQPQQTDGGAGILGGILGGLFSKHQNANPNENGFQSTPVVRNIAHIRSNATPNIQQQQQYSTQQGTFQNRSMPLQATRIPNNCQQGQTVLQHQPKNARYFIAMFDYDPTTMSPNPDGCDEELPFREGDTIRVFGDKDADGFYWGELRGKRGYVPHNMVTEVDESQTNAGGSCLGPVPLVAPTATTTTQSMRNISRDRWGDIYANTPVKRMIALYDYDPQELSPNVDAEQVELSFKTGEIILIYGDMDEDGFFMGELDGVRGLVPSNFLADAPEQFSNQTISTGSSIAQRNLNNRGKSQGLGARGPPPPPRENPASVNQNQRAPARKGDTSDRRDERRW